MTELVYLSLTLFFVFYMLNYSDILASLRAAVIPVLPKWISYPLSCALCFTFWTMGALCFFWLGFVPALFAAPPAVLFLDLVYQRLKGDK